MLFTLGITWQVNLSDIIVFFKLRKTHLGEHDLLNFSLYCSTTLSILGMTVWTDRRTVTSNSVVIDRY